MRKAALLTAICLVAGVVGTAQARDRYNGYGGYTYDSQSGNSYISLSGNSYNSLSGNSYNSYGNGYRGYNSNTGSQWNSYTYGGVTRGTDSRGNSWYYDRNTGNYYNYGTGETRSHGRKW
jgi:hypothetical protein